MQLATVLARAAGRWAAQLQHFVASLLVVLALATPLPSSAGSVCLPLPTPSGIARVCVDIGEPSSGARAPEQAQVPDHVNAQRTPTKSDGTVLSRAGIRPLSMLGDAKARIQAAARVRLGVLEELEALAAAPATAAPDEPLLPGPALRRALFEQGVDPIGLVYGDANIPRSQIIADGIDPVLVTGWLAMATIIFRKKLARLLRRVLLPHHRANHVVMLKVQLAVGGEDAPQLSEHCRTVARMLQEGIIAPRLTHRGVEQPEVKPAAEALTPAVRYASLVMRNATRSPGLVHARVEVDAYHAHNETAAAQERWELMTLNEQLRGLPTREYPHRPGVFQYGTADECPKPGVAGMALVPMPRFLDPYQVPGLGF